MSEPGPITRADITAGFLQRATWATSTGNDAEDNVVALLNLAISEGIVQAGGPLRKGFAVLEKLAESGWIKPEAVGKAVADQLSGVIESKSEPVPGQTRSREFWRVRCVYAYGPQGPAGRARVFDFDEIENARAWFRQHRHEIESGLISYSCLFRVVESMEVIGHGKGGAP